MEVKMNIMIVGVGGQGTLLASRILGAAALRAGKQVKLSEVHGMSQRGGSVVTYVKYGDRVDSPVIEKGEADMIIAFEELEAYRSLPYLKKDGVMIVNTQKTNPMPVITGAMEYPANILDTMKEKGVTVVACDALALAKEAGNIKSVNVALIGVMAKNSPLSKEIWEGALEDAVPAKFLEVNQKAFALGYTH
ncbi:MAG: indolepyruvate oxidoreductase subunit beta [Ruminococcaceae bacterium]|nr:indolepyruvate oxidoreductase subunit beta [Oscillospiraceae bacterium]